MKNILLLCVIALSWGYNPKHDPSDAEKAAIKNMAETKYLQFFKQFQELKFDSALLHFSKDAYIMSDGEIWNYNRMEKGFTEFKKTIRTIYLTVDSLHSRYICPEAVQMTIYYTILQTDTLQKETFFKGVQTVLVNPGLKEGYVNECIEYNDYYSIQYAASVPKEFRTGYTNLNWKHGWAIRQVYPAWLYLLDYMKKQGTSPAKTGEDFGKIIAQTWDPKDGFDGFCNSMVFISQAAYIKSKVLQRDANTLKIEFSKDYKKLLAYFDVKDEELLASWSSAFEQIANRMGAGQTLENKGKTFVMTFSRQ